MRRPVMVGLIAAVVVEVLTGCGGGRTDEKSTIAKAVPPPPLPAASAPARHDGVPASHAVEPVAGEPGSAQHTADEYERASSAGSAAGGTGGERAILSAGDRASFARLAAALGGQSGLAVSGLGLGQRIQSVGALRSAVAWSTAKIPVAMAVVEAGGTAAQQANLTSAITASDNAAALQLWSSLGGGQAAANATDQELRQAGDPHTYVEARALRGSAYTPFGQTAWALRDQARFTAGLPCSHAGAQVLVLMGHIVADQRWGLGAAGVPAQFKGGWGPGSRPGVGGGYLDRQMGVLTVAGKPLAVAIASQPADGSHETGTRNLTSIAHWLVAHADVRRVPTEPTC